MSKKLTAVAVYVAMLIVAPVTVAVATGQDDSASGASPAGWDRVTDIVVIGAGTAGVPAAVAAHEKGCESIIILEKTGTIGGTAALSEGLLAGYDTRVAKALDIHVRSQEMYDMVMRHADYRVDPDLMRITVERSGETIDWLMETMGVPFKQEVRVGYGPLQMMHAVEGRGTGMARAYKAALENRRIEVLLQTPAKELLIDDDGHIAGVLAMDRKGDELRVKSKAVIIATGGYAGSHTLAGLLNPLYEGAFGVGNGAATGDGLIMASRIGASISNTDLLMGVLKDYEILSKHRGNIYSSSIARFAEKCIYVGKAGKRFVPESDGSFMSQGVIEPVLKQMRKDRASYVWAVNDHKNVTQSRAKRGHDLEYLHADTLEELAEIMEVDPQGLAETVERWNSMAAGGVDTELGRVGDLSTIDTAPYYAVAVVPAIPITYGGILRNQRGEVLRNDNTIVNGLYTAGEASASSAYMGFTLSNAVTWGRIAGESAADYVKSGPRSSVPERRR